VLLARSDVTPGDTPARAAGRFTGKVPDDVTASSGSASTAAAPSGRHGRTRRLLPVAPKNTEIPVIRRSAHGIERGIRRRPDSGQSVPVKVPPAVTVTIMIRPPGGPLIVRLRGHQRGKLLRDRSLPDSSSMGVP